MLRAIFHTAIILLVIVPGKIGAAAQEPALQQSSEALRSKTRLVIVDVVAADSKGRPVTGLKAEDFVVLENGKPQKISSFSFQQGKTVTEVTPSAASSKVFSNAPRYTGSSCLNIILLDALNGEFAGHAYGRDQLLKFLDSAPSIPPTAVYALEQKLTLLFDFTTDAKVLKSVVEDFKPKGAGHLEDVYSAASPFAARRPDYNSTARTLDITIPALNALTQALAGYPGRKNLIWVSEGFPINMFPEVIFNDPMPALRGASIGGVPVVPTSGAQMDQLYSSGKTGDISEEVEKLANAMAKAQIAMYPVDAAGLQKDNRLNSIVTMQTLAERTGGKASINSNDVEMGIRTSIDDGSTYYTLAYYPENKVFDGKFRVIHVNTSQPGLSLRYRQGYYALDPDAPDKDADKALARDFSYALSLDSPSATSVQFKAQIMQTSPKLLVKFAIDSRSLTFSHQEGGKQQASISCAIAAYNEKSAFVKQEISSITATVKPEDFPKVLQGALGCERSIDLKPGKYSLVLGVVDRSTRLIGTTTAWVKVP
jgi:VWFA-related protein